MYAGFRPRATRHFCFGKSTQNQFRPCAALWVPPPPPRIKMARELAPLKQPSPKSRFGAPAPPRSKARETCLYPIWDASRLTFYEFYLAKDEPRISNNAFGSLVQQSERSLLSDLEKDLVLTQEFCIQIKRALSNMSIRSRNIEPFRKQMCAKTPYPHPVLQTMLTKRKIKKKRF